MEPLYLEKVELHLGPDRTILPRRFSENVDVMPPAQGEL